MQTISPKLLIHEKIWQNLIHELRRKGNGQGESGAFLLGYVDTNTISRFICYDELDPAAFDSGIIIVHGKAYIRLWKICSENKLMVLADVHTHPGNWTGQSALDREHPMIAQKGHIALIIPKYALNKQTTLRGVGVHEYLGSYKWKTWKKKSRIFKIIK